MSELNSFSRQLCRAMAEQKMTVQRLSEISGIAKSHLSRYRAGVKEPMLCNLVKLCKALPISADFLCGLKDNHDSSR